MQQLFTLHVLILAIAQYSFSSDSQNKQQSHPKTWANVVTGNLKGREKPVTSPPPNKTLHKKTNQEAQVRRLREKTHNKKTTHERYCISNGYSQQTFPKVVYELSMITGHANNRRKPSPPPAQKNTDEYDTGQEIEFFPAAHEKGYSLKNDIDTVLNPSQDE